MEKFIETTGETRDAAIEAALKQLGMDPVSYTHLDVYKRQVSSPAARSASRI